LCHDNDNEAEQNTIRNISTYIMISTLLSRAVTALLVGGSVVNAIDLNIDDPGMFTYSACQSLGNC